MARLINCSREEIALIENATRAWDFGFYAIPFRPEDRILTAMAEYASNYIAFLQVSQKTGAVVEVIPNDAHGQISLEELRKAIDERVKLIAITHVPTNGELVTRRGATLLDMDARGLESMVRASVHYYNSEEEVERFARRWRRCCKGSRNLQKCK